MKEVSLKPCPFCGHVPEDLRDALHPTGIRWRVDRGQRHYIGHKDPRDGEQCWEVNCLEHEGGCGANINADSREEAVRKWNNRALDVVTLTGEEYDALREEMERLQEIVRPKREEECLTMDHWRMRAYSLEANWSNCSRACANEQTKRIKIEARAERLVEALRYAEMFIDTFSCHLRHGRDEAVNEVLPVIRAAMNNE